MKNIYLLCVMCLIAFTWISSAQAQYIYTVAGNDDFGDGGLAINCFFWSPEDAFVDIDGDILVIDGSANVIRKIDNETGIIETVVGNGERGFSGDGGPAVEARLSFPSDLYVDGDGNIYIADTGNDRIRRVDALTGIIETIAGNGTIGFSGDGGPATEANIFYPHSIFLDEDGNIFFSDMYNYRIRKITASTGIIETVVGNGNVGFSGDGGLAVDASLSPATEIHLDDIGNIYITDLMNDRIRKVDGVTGVIETIAGGGGFGPPQDNVLATETVLDGPLGVTLDNDGNIYISEMSGRRIRKIDHATGIIQTVAGNGENGFSGDGGLAVNASLDAVRCHVDKNGNMYLPDAGRIRKVNASTGIIETIAGGNMKDGYLSYQARLYRPERVFADKNGDVYFSDNGQGVIRKIDAETGLIETVAGKGGSGFSGDGGLATEASFSSVSDIFVKNGDIYIADMRAQRLLKVDGNSGIINTVAGKPGSDSSPEDGGLAVNTLINNITSIFVDDDANIYFSVGFPSKIRKIDGESGVVETVAGTDLASFSGDGGPATKATLNRPNDIYVDKAGNIYIADQRNNRIRRVDGQTGIIETVAGNGLRGFSGDGGSALEASLDILSSVAVDDQGNIFTSDLANNRIRKVDAQTGIIETVIGNGNGGFFGDGGPVLEASLSGPYSLHINSSGTMFIADPGNNRIRMVTAGNEFNATIASEETLTTSNPSFNITVGFNRIAPGFDSGDLILTNATAGEVTSLDNRNFVIPIKPEEPGLVEILLGIGKVQDLAGNNNVASNIFSIEYRPEVTGITNKKPFENFEIYPVPASNEINVELISAGFPLSAEVHLVTLSGKAISTTSITRLLPVSH